MATSLDERAITLASIVQSFSTPVSPGRGRSTAQLLAWQICSGLICKSSKQTTKQNSKENFGINLLYGEYSVRNWRCMKKRTLISSCSFCRWVGRRCICEVTGVTLEWSRGQGRQRRDTRVGLWWHSQGTNQASPTPDPAYTSTKKTLGFSHFV